MRRDKLIQAFSSPTLGVSPDFPAYSTPFVILCRVYVRGIGIVHVCLLANLHGLLFGVEVQERSDVVTPEIKKKINIFF